MANLKKTKKNVKKKSLNTKSLVLAAMFAALAYIVAAFFNVFRIPLVGGVDFLYYDAADVVIVLSGFILGPVYAIGVSLVVALLEMPISTTEFIGALMNFLQSAIFACSAVLIYRKNKNITGAIIGLLSASAVTTAFMLGWNFFITPLYMGIPRAGVATMLLPVFLPFNLLKSLINSGITLMVYKPIVSALRSAKFIDTKSKRMGKKAIIISLSTGAGLIIASVAVVLLFFK